MPLIPAKNGELGPQALPGWKWKCKAPVPDLATTWVVRGPVWPWGAGRGNDRRPRALRGPKGLCVTEVSRKSTLGRRAAQKPSQGTCRTAIEAHHSLSPAPTGPTLARNTSASTLPFVPNEKDQ